MGSFQLISAHASLGKVLFRLNRIRKTHTSMKYLYERVPLLINLKILRGGGGVGITFSLIAPLSINSIEVHVHKNRGGGGATITDKTTKFKNCIPMWPALA